MSGMRRCAELLPIEGQAIYKRVFCIMDMPATAPKPNGWVWVPNTVTPQTHYWNALQKVPVAFPECPGHCFVFDYPSLSWVVDLEKVWGEVRRERDERLRVCDWRVLPDAPTPQADREAWLNYRQALRDITSQDDPLAVEWPSVPSVTT